ncbi:MAG: TonB family protein [FCB group bacterium]|nr:TonB family protein [FCB group bacterium]
MKRDIFLSIFLHVTIITAVLLSAPFESKGNFNFNEVIKIKAVSIPDLSPTPSSIIIPVKIPEMLTEAPVNIPLESPSTIKKPKVIKYRKKKPKKKSKKRIPATSSQQTNTNKSSKKIEVGASTAGTPFGGATIDNATFNYPYWFVQAFNKIQSNWHNTVAIDGSVVCVVYFQVIRSGRLIEVRVEQSSGIPAFDESCVAAVERSAPFPPLPKDFLDEIIGITLPFKYEPR